MTTWFAVVAVGLLSYAFRAVPLFSRRLANPGPRVAAFIADAGTASVTAIVVMALRADLVRFDEHALVVMGAFATGMVVAFRNRTLPVVVSSGMAAYAVLSVALNGP
jgi:hypothetical protein